MANNNKAAGSLKNQQWAFKKLGTTSAKAPFTKPIVPTEVAAGRLYGQWVGLNLNGTLCLAEQNGNVVMASCNGVGTEWVLSGAGGSSAWRIRLDR